MDLVDLALGRFNKAGSRAGRGVGGCQPDHFTGKETEEQRTAKIISSFPGPWTLPGVWKLPLAQSLQPVSSAGYTTGGQREGPGGLL